MVNPLDLLEGNITDGYVCVTMTNKELEVMNNMVNAYKKHKHKHLNNIIVRIPYSTFEQPGGYIDQTKYGTTYEFGSVIFEATDSYGITKYVFDSENIQVINVNSWTNLNKGKMLEFKIPFASITMPKNHPIRKSEVVYMMIKVTGEVDTSKTFNMKNFMYSNGISLGEHSTVKLPNYRLADGMTLDQIKELPKARVYGRSMILFGATSNAHDNTVTDPLHVRLADEGSYPDTDTLWTAYQNWKVNRNWKPCEQYLRIDSGRMADYMKLHTIGKANNNYGLVTLLTQFNSGGSDYHAFTLDKEHYKYVYKGREGYKVRDFITMAVPVRSFE
jgi:hypothetical protein